MNAKDTVLGVAQDAVWDFEKLKLDQAEVSFKAGVRDVIRYLISPDNGLRIELHGDKWGKQLKEWGI